MEELSLFLNMSNKNKVIRDLKNKLLPIFNKYNHLPNLGSKNKYFDNYLNCDKIKDLILFTKQNINSNLINISDINQKEYFKNINNVMFDYIDILDNIPNFNVGVFLIPKGNCIPLHNHPNIFVISKVIWGSVVINSFDKITNNDNNNNNIFIHNYSSSEDIFKVEEREKINLNFNDNNIGILTPNKNNIHEVIAYEDSAFFDIILPAYDESKNRPCNYFEKLKINTSTKDEIYLKKLI